MAKTKKKVSKGTKRTRKFDNKTFALNSRHETKIAADKKECEFDEEELLEWLKNEWFRIKNKLKKR